LPAQRTLSQAALPGPAGLQKLHKLFALSVLLKLKKYLLGVSGFMDNLIDPATYLIDHHLSLTR
jgi:hypothetical protein